MKSDTIQCKHHKITIYNAHFTFCAKLESRHSDEHFGMDREHLEPDMIYDWVEFAYQDRYAPGLPMYHHEYVPLAPVREYANWSDKQNWEARQQLTQQVMDKYRSVSEKTTESSLARLSRTLRSLWIRFRSGGR
jgi:hypothetical protein